MEKAAEPAVQHSVKLVVDERTGKSWADAH
jgi:DNA polymerase I-like protein with 3'-5' exonuclease and polymerase domains